MIGELTASEEKATDDMIKTGPGVEIWRYLLTKPSASVGSAQDLPRVEQELSVESHKPIAVAGTSTDVKSESTEIPSSTPPESTILKYGEDLSTQDKKDVTISPVEIQKVLQKDCGIQAVKDARISLWRLNISPGDRIKITQAALLTYPESQV